MAIFFYSLILLTILPAWGSTFERSTNLRNFFVPSTAPDAITAMTNPQFIAPAEITYIRADDLVIGVYLNGVAKAYPENLGWRHEIINDEIGGQFIAVTFCPLTGTALVFDANDANGEQIEFGVSGGLINNNLVMYRRPQGGHFEAGVSLYPQMIYTGINGRFEGDQLELLPAVETTWALWKKLHPDSQVAQGGTGLDQYNRNTRATFAGLEPYRVYPYGDYRTSPVPFLPYETTTLTPRTTLPVKDIVLGICREGEIKSYPFARMAPTAVINDIVGLTPMVIVFDAANKTAIPYDSTVDGQPLSFYQVEAQGALPVEMVDFETRSRWNMLGTAIDGPLEGNQLRQVPAYNSMWFAWDTYYNGGLLWEGEGILEPPTAVEARSLDGQPRTFALGQNVPNPFNPSTHIDFELSQTAPVHLAVYDLQGQRLAVLVDGVRRAGRYRVAWDGTDAGGRALASGVYFYRLTAQDQVETKSMTLIK